MEMQSTPHAEVELLLSTPREGDEGPPRRLYVAGFAGLALILAACGLYAGKEPGHGGPALSQTFNFLGLASGCHSTCRTCSAQNDDTKCTSCSSGKYLSGGSVGQCLDQCPSGFYPNTVTSTCDACDAAKFCETCSDKVTCTTCTSGKHLYLGSCSATCPDGTYADNNVCKACDASCAKCSGSATTSCTACADPLYLDQGTCTETCPAGFYGGSGNTCRVCTGDNCAACTGSATQCTACQSGFRLQPSALGSNYGTCQADCRSGWYLPTTVPAGTTCVVCPGRCGACDSAGTCLSCKWPLFLASDPSPAQCVKAASCPAGTYPEEVGRLCKACTEAANCATCVGPNTWECKTCPSPNFVFFASRPGSTLGYCKENCDPGYYASAGICKACDPSCATCTGPTANDCMTCYDAPSASYLLPIATGATTGPGSCQAPCPDRYYPLVKTGGMATNLCKECDSTCVTCSGSGPTNCLSCNAPSPFFFKPSAEDAAATDTGSYCRAAPCPDGWYSDTSTSTCEACPSPCSTCEYVGIMDPVRCKTCLPQFFLDDTACKTSCPVRKYASASTGTCAACSTGCKMCTPSGSGSTCTLCDSAYYLYNGVCFESCAAAVVTPTYAIGNKCFDCHPTCAQCSGPSEHECTVCAGAGSVLVQGQCKSTCPAGEYRSSVDRTCQPCDSRCDSCVGGSINSCQSCTAASNTVFQVQSGNIGSCEASCDAGYYADASKICRACSQSSGCATCSGTASTCNSCLTSGTPLTHLYQTTCYQTCPVYTYEQADGTCKACSQNCEECVDAQTCTKCSPTGNQYLQDGVCKAACDGAFYGASAQPGSIYFTCHACDPAMDCQTCTGPGNKCTSCPSTGKRLLQSGQCVDACSNGYYQRGTNCLECVSPCQTCRGASTLCTSCKDSPPIGLPFLKGSTCVAEASCPSTGWFTKTNSRTLPGGITVNECLACAANCKTCAGASNVCKSCYKPRVLVVDTCRPEASCPSGSFVDKSDDANWKCLPCDSERFHCDTCKGTASTCTSCLDGRVLNNGVCQVGCSAGYYADFSSQIGTCQACNGNMSCATCSDALTCTTCPDGKYLQPDSSCKAGCPLGYYAHPSSGACTACDSSCLTCTDSDATSCTSCYSDSILDPEQKICVAGACSSADPAGLTTNCWGTCTNVLSNNLNCGSCGRICQTGSQAVPVQCSFTMDSAVTSVFFNDQAIAITPSTALADVATIKSVSFNYVNWAWLVFCGSRASSSDSAPTQLLITCDGFSSVLDPFNWQFYSSSASSIVDAHRSGGGDVRDWSFVSASSGFPSSVASRHPIMWGDAAAKSTCFRYQLPSVTTECTQGKDCLTCSAAAPSTCTTCPLGRYLQPLSLDCKATCPSGYYADAAGTCTVCSSAVSNCLTCAPGSGLAQCTRCQQGFFLAASGLCADACAKAIPNCLACVQPASGPATCAQASTPNWVVQSGSVQACSTAITGCLQCAQYGTAPATCTCLLPSFVLQNGVCTACSAAIANCQDCAQTGTGAITCSQANAPNYVLQSSSIVACSAAIANCKDCAQTGTGTISCSQASTPNYVLQSDSIVACSAAIANCQDCAQTGTGTISCSQASTPNYVLQSGSIVACSAAIANCQDCAQAGTGTISCVRANTPDYVVQSGSVLACSTAMNGCQQCVQATGAASVTCSQAYTPTFVVQSNSVVACSAAIVGCRFCVQSGTSTISCSQADTPNNVIQNGNVVACSTWNVGCQQCAQSGTGTISCVQAKTPNYALQGGNVVACSTAVSNCQSCAQSGTATATCTQCSTPYALHGGRCFVSCSCNVAYGQSFTCSDSSKSGFCNPGECHRGVGEPWAYENRPNVCQVMSTAVGCCSNTNGRLSGLPIASQCSPCACNWGCCLGCPSEAHCDTWSCPGGKVRRADAAATMGTGDNLCCLDVSTQCSRWACPAGKVQISNAPLIGGFSDAHCCQAACSSVTCLGSTVHISNAASTAGSTQAACCQAACSGFTCTGGVLISNAGTTPGNSDAACCQVTFSSTGGNFPGSTTFTSGNVPSTGGYFLDIRGSSVDSAFGFNLGQGVTIAFAARWSSFKSFSRIFDCADSSGNNEVAIFNEGITNHLSVLMTSSAGANRKTMCYSILDTVQHNFVITIGPNGGIQVYKDGVQQFCVLVSTTNPALFPSSVTRSLCYLGRSIGFGDQLFQGSISSFSITSGERPPSR